MPYLEEKNQFFKMGKIESFENLLCWQACREVISLVKKTIQSLPREEKYDLASNMRRAARSTPEILRKVLEGIIIKKTFNFAESAEAL